MATIEVNRENYVRYSDASLKAAIYMYKHKEENENIEAIHKCAETNPAKEVSPEVKKAFPEGVKVI